MTVANQPDSRTPRPTTTEVKPSKRPNRSAAERLRLVEAYDS
jgi:hypothetical protein